MHIKIIKLHRWSLLIKLQCAVCSIGSVSAMNKTFVAAVNNKTGAQQFRCNYDMENSEAGSVTHSYWLWAKYFQWFAKYEWRGQNVIATVCCVTTALVSYHKRHYELCKWNTLKTTAMVFFKAYVVCTTYRKPKFTVSTFWFRLRCQLCFKKSEHFNIHQCDKN